MKNFLHCKWFLILFFPLSVLGYVDPTMPRFATPSVKQSVSKKGMQLQLIIKRSTGNKAVISGKVYRIGERLNEYVVRSIGTQHVLLVNGNKQLKLDLYDYEIIN